jgi:hypothetical protein
MSGHLHNSASSNWTAARTNSEMGILVNEKLLLGFLELWLLTAVPVTLLQGWAVLVMWTILIVYTAWLFAVTIRQPTQIHPLPLANQ